MLHLQHTWHSRCHHHNVQQPTTAQLPRKSSKARLSSFLTPALTASAHAPCAHGVASSAQTRALACRHARAAVVRSLATDEQPSHQSTASMSEQLLALRQEMDLPMGKLVCRAYEADDAVGACVVLTRAFAGTPEEISINDANKYVDRVQENVPRGIVYVAVLFPSDPALRPPTKDYRVIGTVALSLHEDTLQQIPTLPPPPHTAYLSNMAVDQKFRRMGVARTLLAISEQAVVAARLKELYLHVRQGDEPAHALYLSTGYTEVARDNFIAAQLKKVRPRILMRKVVHAATPST